MRDLIYKSITSQGKRRKIISSSEEFRRQGIHTTVVRHFICIIKRIKDSHLDTELKPQIYIFRHHDSDHKKERFFCRIRGKLCLVQNKELFWVNFAQSVRINVEAGIDSLK